jgi:hypothetical protein
MTRALAAAAVFGIGVYVGLALAEALDRAQQADDPHWESVQEVTH